MNYYGVANCYASYDIVARSHQLISLLRLHFIGVGFC